MHFEQKGVKSGVDWVVFWGIGPESRLSVSILNLSPGNPRDGFLGGFQVV